MNSEIAAKHDGDGSKEMFANDLDLLVATNLASSGKLDQAESILGRITNVSSSCAALDLMARISVKKGEFDTARRLWRRVMDIEPSNAAAKAALAELHSPWFALAVFKRISVLFCIALIIGLAFLGLFALQHIHVLIDGNNSGVLLASSKVKTLVTPIVQQPIHTRSESPEIVHASVDTKCGDEVIKAPTSVKPPPYFSLPGALVTTNATETRIVFEDGIFIRRCELSDSALTRLTLVAQTVAEHGKGCLIIVEGYTDSDPISSGSPYQDNFDLGLHRGLAAAEVFKKVSGISAQDILVASAGDNTTTLFPGDDIETKLKNRTVVIRIMPKTGVSPIDGAE